MAATKERLLRLSISNRAITDSTKFVMAKAPSEHLCLKYYVDINSRMEFVTVLNTVINRAKQENARKHDNTDFVPMLQPLRENILLQDMQNPNKPVFVSEIRDEHINFQAIIQRPSLQIYTNTLPENRIFRLCDAFVDELLDRSRGIKNVVSEIRVLDLNTGVEKEQARHIDFSERNPAFYDFSFMLANDKRANISIWASVI